MIDSTEDIDRLRNESRRLATLRRVKRIFSMVAIALIIFNMLKGITS